MVTYKTLIVYSALGVVLVNGLPPAPKESASIVARQKALLEKELRSKVLRETAKKNFDRLRLDRNSGRAEMVLQDQAILFFADIKGKGVLLGLLRSEDLGAKCLAVKCGLDAFGIEDLLSLYEAALKSAEPPLLRSDSGELTAIERAIVGDLCLRTSKILGLKPSIPATNASKDIRNWWLGTLRKAKAERSYQSELDAAVKYFQQNPEVLKRPGGDALEEQRAALLEQKLRSEELKEMVKANMEWLRPEPRREKEKRREAVLFFCDIKATGVLAALLHSENKDLKEIAMTECLDLFRVQDVVSLYESAAAHAKASEARPTTIDAANLDLIHQLAKRTSRILGLKPSEPKSAKAEDIRAWWAQAVRDAQTRGIYRSEIDAALKYVESK